jgi:hypothetical protein
MTTFCNQALSLPAVEPAMAYLTRPLEPAYGPSTTKALERALSAVLLPYHTSSTKDEGQRPELLMDDLGRMCVSLDGRGPPYVVWPSSEAPDVMSEHSLRAIRGKQVSVKMQEAARARLLLRSLVLQTASDLAKADSKDSSSHRTSSASTLSSTSSSELPYNFPAPPAPTFVINSFPTTQDFSDHTSARHIPPFATGLPNTHADKVWTPAPGELPMPSQSRLFPATYAAPPHVQPVTPPPSLASSSPSLSSASLSSSRSSPMNSPRPPRSSSLAYTRSGVGHGMPPSRTASPSPSAFRGIHPYTPSPSPSFPQVHAAAPTGMSQSHNPAQHRRERTHDGIWWSADGVPGGTKAPRTMNVRASAPLPTRRPNTAPSATDAGRKGEVYLYQGGVTNVLGGGVALGVRRTPSA